MKAAVKLGVTEKEIAKLCDAVLAALERGPLDPENCARPPVRPSAISARKARRRVTTTLPLALGKLQASGDIRRVPTNGRFDQQRYQYALWRPNPLRGFKLPPEQVHTELARNTLLDRTGVGCRLSGFLRAGRQSGQGRTRTPEAGSDRNRPWRQRFSCPGDRAKFDAFKPPKEPRYSLLGSIDSLFLLRNDFKGLLDPKDLQSKVRVDSGMKDLGSLTDLPSHAIVDRGRLIGLWEYDPATESIAWMSFVKKDKALQEAVTRTENFVRDQLGDARSFSLDSPKSRAPRIEALRKAAASA
jgi:hypothetical protein